MTTQLPLIVYGQAAGDTAPRRCVADLPAEERPQYRLRRHGEAALSATELLALLLGTAQGPGLAQDLLTRLLPDDALQVAAHERVGVRAERAADDVVGYARVRHPVPDTR